MYREDTRFARAIQKSQEKVAVAPVRISLTLLFVAIVIGGGLFSLFEHGNWWDGMYWAVVVMSTVGFGDFSPESVPGRVIFAMILPIGIFSTGIITGAFIGEILERKLEHHQDTPELDDDFDHLDGKLGEVQADLKRLKSITSHPKIKAVLVEVHKEMSTNTGGNK